MGRLHTSSTDTTNPIAWVLLGIGGLIFAVMIVMLFIGKDSKTWFPFFSAGLSVALIAAVVGIVGQSLEMASKQEATRKLAAAFAEDNGLTDDLDEGELRALIPTFGGGSVYVDGKDYSGEEVEFPQFLGEEVWVTNEDGNRVQVRAAQTSANTFSIVYYSPQGGFGPFKG